MTKKEAIDDPNSCWNRARDDEHVFVLLERDIATPATIRDWIIRRIQFGKNKFGDPQLLNAEAEADQIERLQYR